MIGKERNKEYTRIEDENCNRIHNVYEELGFKLGPLPLYVNNQGIIFLALNPAQEGHIKHTHIPNHYICEAVEFGEVKLYHVPTDQQYADIFMKNLAKLKPKTGRKALCLIKHS